MTVLGKNTAGSTTTSSSGNKAVVSPVTASVTGKVLSGGFKVAVDTGTGSAVVCVYADSSGAPGALLAISNTITITNTTSAFLTTTFTGTNQIILTSGTSYWVGATWPDPGTNNIIYDRDATANQRDEQSTNQPNPFGTPTLVSTGPIAAYVDLFPVAGAAAVAVGAFNATVTTSTGGTSAHAGVARISTAALTPTTTPKPGVPVLQNVATGIRLLLEAAWGADLTDLTGATWTWTDITTDIILSEAEGLAITLGTTDEITQSQTSNMTLTLDNSEAAYSLGPQNTVNYPNLVRGVPIRVRISTDGGITWLLKYQGNAVEWTPNWDVTGVFATVTLTASGPLRQLNQGSLPATSYYAQTIPTSSLFPGLLYYWNNEGGNGVEGSDGISQCFPTVPAGIIDPNNAAVLNANLAYLPNVIATTNSSAFPISGPVPSAWDFSSGTLPATTNTGHLQFRMMIAISSLPTGQTQPLLYWKTSSSSTLLWALYLVDNGNLFISNGTNATGSGGFTGTQVSFGANGQVYYLQLQMTTNGSGSNVTVDAMKFDGTSGGFTWNATGSTTGYCTYVNWIGPNINSTDTPIMETHMTIQNAQQSVLTMATFYQGNPGESVSSRMTRIANAANIPITIYTATNPETSTNPADTMGGQFFDSTSSLLRECEATGVGRLYDGLNAGLTYVPRVLRMSQQPSLTLDVTQGAVIMPFQPVYDDQQIYNQATVSRRNGSSVTYTDNASAAQIGVYSNSYSTNQEDDSALLLAAQWYTNLGTPEGYRYPTFSFDLEKQPSLIPSWLNCFPACRMDVTNISTVRGQHPAGTVRNVLEGWTETIGQFRWHVDANCSSYEPWKVVTLAAATGTTLDTVGRYESDGSTIVSSVAFGGTSLSVATPSGPLWTQSSVTADDFPLTIAVNGIPVTVTAISGASSPQTFTVLPLAHGVSAGNAVTIYQNAVLGM